MTPTPVLSLALAAGGVPVVSRLALTCAGEPVQAASVTLSVRTAEGPLGPDAELRVDLEPGRTVVVPDAGLRLDPAVMSRIGRGSAGTMDVEVRDGDRLLADRSVPVRVLAAGEWPTLPRPLSSELLAAHVLPQHPAVTALVGAAADILAARTGDPAMAASAADPERIDQVAGAVVDAVRRRGVRAAGAAERGELGRPIRSPVAVLEDRIATPLDLVTVLAAALEQAGLEPLLWLTADHAFLGYWRERDRTGGAVTPDVAALTELVDRGRIALVEPALLTDAAGPATFGDLHRAPYTAWLTGDLLGVLGVTDVVRARLAGIAPLPVRIRGADGEDTEVGYDPAVHSRAATRRASAGRWRWPGGDPRRRLLDVSPDSGLALSVPGDDLAPLAELVVSGAPVTLVPSNRPRQVPAGALLEDAAVRAGVLAADYPARLRELAARARTAVAETGAVDLHLCLGSLVWELDGRPVRSPLVLVPVVLSGDPDTGAYRIALAGAGAVTRNGELLDALRRVHGLLVPEPEPGGSRLDPVAELEAVARAVTGLPWRVQPTAELAFLPVAASRQLRDLAAHWADFARNPLLAALAARTAFADPVPEPARVDLDELAARCPLPADADQLRAVAETTAGRTFVLEGAPGTGKSQTIANLAARAVAEGRRVLVVAGKRTALDVVARRLETAGLGSTVLPLHRPATVSAAAPATGEHGADPERRHAARRALADYARRLHEENRAGLSYWSAWAGMLAAGDDVPALPVPPGFVTSSSPQTVDRLRRTLGELPGPAAGAGPRSRSPWGFLDDPDADPYEVAQAAVAVDRAVAELPADGPPAAVLAEVRTPEDLDALAAVLAAPAVPLDVFDATRTAGWSASAAAVGARTAAFPAAHPVLAQATPAVLDLPLAELAAAARDAAAANPLARRRRLLAVLARLAPGLRADAEVDPHELPQLTAALREAQAAAGELLERAAAVPGLAPPSGWTPLTDGGLLARRVQELRRAGTAVAGSTGFSRVLREAAVGPAPAAAVAVARLRDAVEVLLSAGRTTSEQLAAWAGPDGLPARWRATAEQRDADLPGLPALRGWLDLLDRLQLFRAAGLEEAREVLLAGAVPAEDAARAFARGLAETAMAERRAATGLDAFDGEEHERTRRQFVAATRAARAARVAGARGVCVLASPDAVARLLPAGERFDLVVFDEASRLPVAAAAGGLGRARAAVVVGDRRQLPPPDGAEGLLAACARAGVPRLELSWHYRSRDEALIAFSNTAVYGGGLKSFPAPSEGTGISLVRTDGTFVRTGRLRGTNPGEAAAVVAEVRRRFAAVSDAVPSLAVVTLTPQQRSLVEGMLRDAGDRLLVEALDAPDGVCVTDVEHAQGDERETVLLSVVLGVDERGVPAPDVGPLAGPRGPQALNVAVTRARREVVVFCSFDPAALPAEETSSPGIRLLRAYLDLAALGPAGVPRDGRTVRLPDPHREEIAAALRARGLAARTDVGLSEFRIDLAVAPAPGAPEAAVLLDGPAWARRPTVWDRDALPADVLAGRQGWARVERVWLPAWLADREGVLDRLEVAARDAAARTRERGGAGGAGRPGPNRGPARGGPGPARGRGALPAVDAGAGG
ncbi:DUF4011 domain-containing protein [Geodermatophilus ruber]|uniref:AAA domain-containing protein n=1 Tax=Geodermatophilus ruber TaxID=504800 RepID=A0A1I4H7E6_9ACTN|nr:DUF4011 domain-containing protein [Geodermatophilus ruber]SFL38085.1 AAA domain-containing protein [Geodermatophilus ruber]